ncbi:MAG: cell envelope integrity protein CreD [Sphingobacteriales bacterium]|nr:cell envelope integrity protein CreD [Sphingobacteriales bacterium]
MNTEFKNQIASSPGISFRIWFYSTVILAVIIFLHQLYTTEIDAVLVTIIFFIAPFVLSIPAFLMLMFIIPVINRASVPWQNKLRRLIGLEFFIVLAYGFVTGPAIIFIDYRDFENVNLLTGIGIAIAVLFTAVLLATVLELKNIAGYFSNHHFTFSQAWAIFFNLKNQNINSMESSSKEMAASMPPTTSFSNKVLIKGVITGALILLLLIPSFFITNLVTERQQRQKEVVKEVSSKWATEQTLSGPYLVLPYTYTHADDTGKTYMVRTNLVVFADNLKVNGELFPKNRQRSIYKVLLYRSSLAISGTFKPQWPSDVTIANIDFANAKLCFGISDFKGLEEEVKINFNNHTYSLSPGLPLTDVSDNGLSAPVSLQTDVFTVAVPFNVTIKLHGSERLHFLPLAANSRFDIKSAWPHPSFDGNVLPNDHTISDKGFNASWSFNRANLPFNMVSLAGKFKKENLGFGVSIVQPADQYDKTMRSVKYAVLFIGLTFAFFFIIELLQKKPFHPVQYVLVGLGLLIFYTLLLSISEFILFDYAYGIAAIATIAMISLYAKSHFTKWSIAGVFAAALTGLYGFIFVLIQLEDTALLLGSIGLFFILAGVMYLSRKIKWYGANYQAV